MLLKKFNYSEFDEKPMAWSISGMDLASVNLLVGKNAVGKTNTITRIFWLANLISGSQSQLINSANFFAEFDDCGIVFEYTLRIAENVILNEQLRVDGIEKFIRSNDGTGTIFAVELNSDMKFQIPNNQLVVVAKRDAIQHPFLESLAAWAEGVRFYPFSTDLGQNVILQTNDVNNIIISKDQTKDTNSVIALYIKGEKDFPVEFKERIISAMKDIGYDLEDVGSISISEYHPLAPVLLYIVERSNPNLQIIHQMMSRGMFRAFSLVIQVTYNTLNNISTTILVDDVGEGLDYERSTNTIKVLMKLMDCTDCQLIMSTNDRFVMNSVPIENWQVIHRDKGACKVYNYDNAKEQFDEFRFTGLSNFDFLATEFVLQDR